MARTDPQLNVRIPKATQESVKGVAAKAGVSVTSLICFILEENFIAEGKMTEEERVCILPQEKMELIRSISWAARQAATSGVTDTSGITTIAIGNNSDGGASERLIEHLEKAQYHMDQARAIARSMGSASSIVFADPLDDIIFKQK